MKDYRSKAEQAIEGLMLMKRNVKENSHEDYYLNCGIKALSKDVPAKVETHTDLRRFSIDSFCPVCHNMLCNDRDIKYCEACGQRLYWE